MLKKFLTIAPRILLILLGVFFLWLSWQSKAWAFVLPALFVFLTAWKPKIFLRIFLVLFGLLLMIWLLLQTELVQNFIINKVTAHLSKELKTEVNIKHVSLSLFNKMDMNEMLLRDMQGDTLLYAGSLKVRITDWFFFKDKAELKYIGLENAVIKQYRKDSTWNFQFLIDYFSPSDKTKDTTAKAIELNIQKVDLKNVTYLKNDSWAGQKMTVKTSSLLLDADKIDINNKIFLINSIELDKSYFIIEKFDGLEPDLPDNDTEVKDTGLYFNSTDIFAKVKSLKITDGYFGIGKRGDKPENGVFDGSNIQANKIAAIFSNLSFIKDTIKAAIDISAKERSGFELKKLKARFRLTPKIMEFANLDIRTNSSRITDYYAMRFKDFNKDMGEYVQKVIMDARFRNAAINTDDIAYFAPELNSWKQKVELSGRYFGTVSNFNINNLFLRSNANSYVSGNLAMKGLPDVDKTIISLTNATLQTNSREASFLYLPLKTMTEPNLAALGNLQFKGNLMGTLRSFTANGNISTYLGGIYSNLTMSFPKKAEPEYRGTIETKQFDIGKFLNISSLGKVGFTGKINGYSFALDKLKTSLDGSFSSLDFNGYTYTNLIFNGSLQKKKFNGEFKADDPNFNFTSNIEIDLSGDQPRFNVLGDLASSNLQKLKLVNKDFRLSGFFDLNFSGRNIDDFLGSAKILNATLLHDSSQLSFDSLSLNAYHDTANMKVLSISSNEFDVAVRGQYNILDLSTSFQTFLNHYYPAYINQPESVPKNQRFVVVVSTRDFSKYANIIDSNLSGLDDMELTGGVNTIDSGFFLQAKIPFAKYKQYRLHNADINGHGDYSNLTLSGGIEKIYVSDSFYFPNTELKIQSSNDHSIVHIATSANQTLNQAELNADIYTLQDGVRISFQPSSFLLNDKKWNLEKEGELDIRKHFATAKNVKFIQGYQEISIESENEEGGNTSNLNVKLKNVNLGDFVSLFVTRPVMEGVANGNVYLRDFYGKFKMDAVIKAEQFRLDDDSVGIVNVKANYNNEIGKVSWDVQSDNEKYNFTASGYYNTKDSTAVPLYNSFHLTNTKIDLVNEFLTNIFDHVTGLATGDLVIKGEPSALQLLGKVAVRDAGLTVKFTKVHYTIDSAVFNFSGDGIDFGSFTIRDKYKNTGTARGILYENGFKDMRYDFDLSTNNLLLLDTKQNDNDQFYGKAIGKATLSLKGPQNDMKMTITGETSDTSHIFIPTSTSKQSAEADFIVFKQYGTELVAAREESDTRLSIDLDLTANEKTQIDVILDELTGDIIRATGNGRIQIHVPANGDLTMKGRYNIEKGSYDFNFQSLVKKPFELLADAGNYIEWTGNPYNANIHIDAQYTASNVSMGDLVSNSLINVGSSAAAYRGDVFVIAELRGKLTKPDISFRFDFPPNSVIKNDQDLQVFLRRLQSDENRMLKQVTWLIVFGSFFPESSGISGTGIVKSVGVNTISQKISNEVNKMLSNVLYKLTGDRSLQFDIGTSTYSSSSILYGSSGSGTLDRQTVNLKVNQSLLNGKLIITFGGNLDFGLTNTATAQSGNFQWLPDISVQIVLTRDRKLRAVVFNKSTLDVSGGNIGRRTRQGVSISYTRDFDKLFGDKKEVQILPAAPDTQKKSGSD